MKTVSENGKAKYNLIYNLECKGNSPSWKGTWLCFKWERN